MKIILGKNAGFCYGVKKAVEESEKLAKNNDIIYCLGELVHNKQVIDSLIKKGIIFIQSLEEIKKEDGSKVIIRAHGVEKQIYEKSKTDNITLIDNTCPNVLKIHEIVEDYAKKGYYILLTGLKEHPENIGTISYCGKYFCLVQDENDIEEAIKSIKNSRKKDILLISQTTYSISKFESIIKILQNRLKAEYNLIIKNTICVSTQLRQKETDEISKKVDMMIIIGGKNSSNTRKLYEIADKNCKNTICVETKEEIVKDLFTNVNTVGIMAGASTPQKSIDDIIKTIKLV